MTLHREQGWSISTLSAAITAHFLVSALLITRLPTLYRRWASQRDHRGNVSGSGRRYLAWTGSSTALATRACARAERRRVVDHERCRDCNAMVAPWFDAGDRRRSARLFNGAVSAAWFYADLGQGRSAA